MLIRTFLILAAAHVIFPTDSYAAQLNWDSNAQELHPKMQQELAHRHSHRHQHRRKKQKKPRVSIITIHV